MTFRKVMAALLALTLLVPMAARGEGAMGRYVEQALTYPDPEGALFAQGEGVIYAVDKSGQTLYTSSDMMTWTQTPTGHDEGLAPAHGGINRLAVGADGAIYLTAGLVMRDDQGLHTIERIAGGAPGLITLDKALSWTTDGLEFCVLPSGEMVALSNEAAYRFSPEGAMVAKYPVTDGQMLAAYGDELAICSWREGAITVFSIKSGQVVRTLELPTAATYGLIGYDREGALYYVCQDGLYRVNVGGTLMVEIVDGRLTTLGRPSAYPVALLFDRLNDPVISFADYQSGAQSLVAYRYDEGVATEPSTVLSVYALYDTKILRQNAALFQRDYPGVLVDITIGLAPGSALTRDDAIRTLNTAILAGKGPDVLVLDGLPLNSYLEKGMLADLSGVVKPMIDQGLLMPSLAGAFERAGAIPVVPTRFYLPTLWGDVAGMATLSDMAAYAAEHPQSMPYYAVFDQSLIGTFYLSCAPSWAKQDGYLDQGQVEAFLTGLKGVRGAWNYEYFVGQTGWDIKELMKNMGQAMPAWDPYAPFLRGQTLEEMYGTDFLVAGQATQLPFLLRGPDAACMPNGALDALGAGDVVGLPGQATGCYVPCLMMGAVGASPRADMARDFIRIALEEALQSADMMEGFPVNIRALDQAQAREDSVIGSTSNGIYSTVWPDQAMRAKLRAIIDGLHTPVVPDFTLFDMIMQESAPYLEGRIDAGQAAANLCAKVGAYLSE